ncbi:unnamed protein product, partial [Symbiodinium microadriaticum]
REEPHVGYDFREAADAEFWGTARTPIASIAVTAGEQEEPTPLAMLRQQRMEDALRIVLRSHTTQQKVLPDWKVFHVPTSSGGIKAISDPYDDANWHLGHDRHVVFNGKIYVGKVVVSRMQWP